MQEFLILRNIKYPADSTVEKKKIQEIVTNLKSSFIQNILSPSYTPYSVLSKFFFTYELFVIVRNMHFYKKNKILYKIVGENP
ncbi:hypothetical protein SAMN04487931_103144 [Desulfobacula phenolica]|uniref:Uncharacterized protein n=1 Tax=Desulfobacula phenolica TaxID=90732 RepID=A0A1H2EJG7_9BACT|nr:hypothetical protein SAMN04487931_103144 [Desulfobacula phenolica]